jgi:hypothetical protein
LVAYNNMLRLLSLGSLYHVKNCKIGKDLPRLTSEAISNFAVRAHSYS